MIIAKICCVVFETNAIVFCVIVKVKEPQPEEMERATEGSWIFSFLHLAAERELTKSLMEKKVAALAFETLENERGQLPLLIPMSEVRTRG